MTTVNFATASQLTTIAQNGFSECPLTSLTLPNQLVTIGSYSFYHNQLTGTLTIPATITYIGDNAFERSSGSVKPALATLDIGEGAGLTIGPAAFKYHAFTTITIPDLVTINTTNSDTMGANGSGFYALYRPSGNGNAGIYHYAAPNWSKD